MPYKVVVSDNGSTDETVKYLQSLKNIEFINNGENLGFSKGHNKIMKLYKDHDIVLLNNDVEVPFGWLSTLSHCMEKRKLGAVSPAIKVANGLDVGAVLDARARGRSIINGYTKPDWITGSCLFIARDTINKIGMLDENFSMYYEDVDYCLKMRKAGIKFECIRDTVITHNDSTSSTPPQKKVYMEESRKYFAKKWGYKA
jgi:GT2 family glycosyltransferase